VAGLVGVAVGAETDGKWFLTLLCPELGDCGESVVAVVVVVAVGWIIGA
jgi:hypothetical protein